MLFDLRSRRRRSAVKVIYGMLALIMVAGLVLVGVGTGTGGGLLNGLTNNGTGGVSGVDLAPVNAALKAVRRDPTAANYAALIQARWGAANQGSNATQAGAFTRSGLAELSKLEADYAHYTALQTNPSPNVAILAARAYAHTGNYAQASVAWEVVAAAQNSANAFYCLAVNSYAARDETKGNLAAARAEQLAPKLQRLILKQQLQRARANAAAYALTC
jgi:hypothetical protein